MTPESYNRLFRTYQSTLDEKSEEKFHKGKEKYGDAWLDVEPEYLCRRMEEELYEFRQAVEHYRDDEEAIEELADMMNFGLMYLIREMEDGS